MAKDDHPPQGGWRDNIGFCISVFYLIFAIAAFVLTLATAGGCDILLFDPQRIPPGEEPLLPPELRHLNETLVGLYRYDPDGNGCRKVSDDFDSVGGWYTGARVGNSLAIIFGAVALVLYLIELCCCRYPCSRLLIAISWGVAFISSALVFLMYNTDLCQPPFRDASYPCSPEKGTWIGVSATVLLFIVTCWTCCNAKPTPIFMRVREYAKNDQNDACCAICKKEKKEDEAEAEGTEEEEGEVKDKEAPQDDADVVVAGGAVVEPGKEEEPGEGEEETKEEQHPMTQQEVDEHATKAVVVTTLATARRGKQDEIEKQLELLTKYKDNIPEEEYNEKVGKLLAALPDPDTFDRYTKTADLNDMHDNEEKEEKDEEKGLDKDEDEEKDEEKGLDDDDEQQQHGDDEDGSNPKDGGSEEKQGGGEEEADLLGMEEGKEEEEEEEEVKQSRASKAASATKGAAVATGAAIGSGFKAMAKPFHKTSKPADAAMEVETEVDA